MLIVTLVAALFVASACGQATNPVKNLHTQFKWQNLEFGFPSRRDREKANSFGWYEPKSVIPLDIDMSYAGGDGEPRYFMTIPRFGKGVPYTLAEVTNITKDNGPLLKPFPSYKFHNEHGKSCEGITSAYRTAIDECDRMWVIDSGTIGFDQVCPAQLIAFDLNTNKEVERFEIPSHLYKGEKSLLVTPVVDVSDPPPGKCTKTKVYVADSIGNGIIVCDIAKKSSWRIENLFTGPDKRFSQHTIAGESFTLGDGVFGMSLTPRNLEIPRYLFFHALASDSEISVPLNAVNNPRVWRKWNGGAELFNVLGNRRTQCTQEAISSNGYQFCAYNNPLGIFAWDIETPYTRSNRFLVAHNPKTLQFVSGLKIVRNRFGDEELLLISNRLQKYYSKTMNYNEINFRVQSCPVESLLYGTVCSSSL